MEESIAKLELAMDLVVLFAKLFSQKERKKLLPLNEINKSKKLLNFNQFFDFILVYD